MCVRKLRSRRKTLAMPVNAKPRRTRNGNAFITQHLDDQCAGVMQNRQKRREIPA
jgi:hypothetical protein